MSSMIVSTMVLLMMNSNVSMARSMCTCSVLVCFILLWK
jgi:hypothetical protein